MPVASSGFPRRTESNPSPNRNRNLNRDRNHNPNPSRLFNLPRGRASGAVPPVEFEYCRDRSVHRRHKRGEVRIGAAIGRDHSVDGTGRDGLGASMGCEGRDSAGRVWCGDLEHDVEVGLRHLEATAGQSCRGMRARREVPASTAAEEPRIACHVTRICMLHMPLTPLGALHRDTRRGQRRGIGRPQRDAVTQQRDPPVVH